MSETHAPRRTLASIGAVLAGLVFIIVTSLGTDAVLYATGVFPPRGQPTSDSLYLLMTAYRIVYCVAGCCLTARLAPAGTSPMRHAMSLGIIGLVLSIIGAAATWNAGPEFGPRWYPLALVATALPCAWIGGMLYRR